MKELRHRYPAVESLVALAPEELGPVMAELLRERFTAGQMQNGLFNSVSIVAELGHNHPDLESYLGQQRDQALLAVAEGWAWMEANGVVVRPPNNSPPGPWRVLSRRGRVDGGDKLIANAAAVRLLAKELLHTKVAHVAWPYFMRGDFETAAFKAMKEVEIELRDAMGAGQDLTAVQLARMAFNPNDGMLSDPNASASEREAMAHLFAGALGVLKNPHSHRNVDMQTPQEAAAILLFASYLVGVINERWVAFVLG